MKIHQLGKRAVRMDKRTLQFNKYRLERPIGVLPPVPDEVSWVTKVPPPWMMFLNDRLGCCVESAMAHMVMQWSFYAGKETVLTNADVLKAYEDIGGYVPDDPNDPETNNTDNGSDMLTALNYWRKTGIGGHKILAYMAVDPTNLIQVRESIELFGNVFVGIQLPLSAQGQDAWTVAQGGTTTDNGAVGGWGGHAIPWDASSPITHTCITWGERLKLSHNFGFDYVDEMYAVLSEDWMTSRGLSPNHFNLAQLKADLAAIK